MNSLNNQMNNLNINNNSMVNRNEIIAVLFKSVDQKVEMPCACHIAEDFVTISGAIFGYGPTLLPVSFVVRNEMGMKYFEGLDVTPSNPVFTKVWGRINCMTIKTEKTEESAFGEAAVQTYERKSREYVVTGTAKVPYDFGDEEVLTAADVNKMMQDRQVMLAEVEKRYNERQTNKTAGGVNFNATAATKTAQTAVPEGGFVF